MSAADREELIGLLEVCVWCDLIYDAHMHGGYGLGTEVFGVKITEETNVKDLALAAIARLKALEHG